MRRGRLLAVLLVAGLRAGVLAGQGTAPAGSGGLNLPGTVPAARLPIVQSTDTTIIFRVLDLTWVREGTLGSIVNPRERDQLVGRFVVARVDSGVALGSILGLTTGVDTLDVAVLPFPKTPWYRRVSFWVGTAIGAIVGAVAGVSLSGS